MQYRVSKQQKLTNRNKFVTLPKYPPKVSKMMVITTKEQKSFVKRNAVADSDASIASFKCNRGVAVSHHTNRIICFCPPSYYGDYCEYHSDRLTSHVHLNVSNSSYAPITIDQNMTIKVLVLLMHENQIIHNRQFHVRSAVDFHRLVKKNYHLIYSREAKLLEEKIRRRSNRSLIVDHNSYYLRYEVYELRTNSSIRFVSVWQYPIFFDFLPSFRLAKVLRFHQKRSESFLSPCLSNSCNFSNAKCRVLQNDPEKYVCLCDPGYSGEQCSNRDQHCTNNFCHSDSLCKPTYMGSTAGTRLPFCLCPLNVYGTRCGLVHDQCWSNPCKNNGTCYPSTSDFTKINCVCHKDYYGKMCEIKKEAIDLTIHANNVSGVTLVQYFYIDFRSLDLTLAHQSSHKQPPDYLHYPYASMYSPNIVLLKSFSDTSQRYPKIFVSSVSINEKKVNSSTTLTDKNLCVNVENILPNIPGEFLISV